MSREGRETAIVDWSRKRAGLLFGKIPYFVKVQVNKAIVSNDPVPSSL